MLRASFAALVLVAAVAAPAGARDCPIPECAAPPEDCSYQGPPATDENGCPVGCGTLVCGHICPVIDCAAPPEGCHYDGVSDTDANGCATSCGGLVCAPVLVPPPEHHGGCSALPGRLDGLGILAVTALALALAGRARRRRLARMAS